MRYNKLVRDGIPGIIRKNGREPRIHIAGREEYWAKLKEKLQEEVDEFTQEPILEEMADIVEVLNAICIFKGWEAAELSSVRRKKAAERGRFEGGVILDEA